MDKKKRSLATMQAAKLARAEPSDIEKNLAHFKVDMPADKIAEYVGHFAKPLPDQECCRCEERATFIWGLTHGHGHCHSCGWPGVLYHFPKDADGKTHRFECLLWHHPDDLSERKSSAA